MMTRMITIIIIIKMIIWTTIEYEAKDNNKDNKTQIFSKDLYFE